MAALVAVTHNAHEHSVRKRVHCRPKSPECRLYRNAIWCISLPHLHFMLGLVEVPAAQIVHFGKEPIRALLRNQSPLIVGMPLAKTALSKNVVVARNTVLRVVLRVLVTTPEIQLLICHEVLKVLQRHESP
jgi:hypothetical protein